VAREPSPGADMPAPVPAGRPAWVGRRWLLVACGLANAASAVGAGTVPGSVRPVAWGFAVAFAIGSGLLAAGSRRWGGRVLRAAALVDLAGILYGAVFHAASLGGWVGLDAGGGGAPPLDAGLDVAVLVLARREDPPR
jgi:hypothetical protein